MDASLKEVQLTAQCWELEAKEVVDKAAWAEAGAVGGRGDRQCPGASGVGIDPGPMRPDTSEGSRLKAEFELDSVQ